MYTMSKKQIKFDGHNLLLKVDDNVKVLGNIATHKGQLTRAQKLKAVQFMGQWIEI